MARDDFDDERLTPEQERAEEARYEARMEYAEEEYEARQFRRSLMCQCLGDMPGSCPGPAACPMCDDDDGDTP